MAFEKELRMKYFKTFLLIYVWFARGFEISMIGSTLPDLRVRFNTDAAGISYALSIGKIGALFGSPLTFFMDRFGSYFDLIYALLLAFYSLATFVRPSSTYLWLFTVCDFICEFSWAAISPGGKSLVLNIWGAAATPYVQALLLGYPVGGIFGPLVAGIFVSDNTTEASNSPNETAFSSFMEKSSLFHQPDFVNWYIPWIQNENGYSRGQIDSNDDSILGSFYDASEFSNERYPDDSSIEYAFYIAGTIIFIGSVLFMISFCTKTEAKNAPMKSSYTLRDIVSPSKWTEGLPCFGVTMLILMVLFMVAMENQNKVIELYLPSYTVDGELGFTNQEATRLSSVYYFSAAVGRFISIFLAKCIPVKYLFVGDVIGGLVTAITLGLFGPISKATMFTFACLFSFLYRSIRGFAYSFINQYMILIAVLFGVELFTVGLTNVFLQALHGFLYDNTFIGVIFYLGVIYGAIYFVIMLFMLIIGWKVGTLQERRKNILSTKIVEDTDEVVSNSGTVKVFNVSEDAEKNMDDYTRYTDVTHL